MAKVFVGRQPIYDRKMNVFAYELLFRSGAEGGARFTDGDAATSQVLLNTFLEIGVERIAGESLAFVNLTRDLLLNADLELPKEKVVLEVLENIDVDPVLVGAVERLHKAGYRIALDDFAFEPRWEPLLKLAHVVKVEIPALDWAAAPKMVQGLRRYKAKLLAEKVETHEEHERLLKMGFDLFQGYFYCKPLVIEGRRLSSNRLGVLRLMARVNDPAIEVGELEKLIRQDASLSYKLIKYLNSPFFGLRNRVESVRQAITYLGLRTLRTWVTLLAMSGVQDKPPELLKNALQRGRMCELLAKGAGKEGDERFFTTGLLSVLDALMDLPMEQVLQELPLSEEVKAAIIHQEGPLGEALRLAMVCERGEWYQVADLSVPGVSLPDVFLDSLQWADEMASDLKG